MFSICGQWARSLVAGILIVGGLTLTAAPSAAAGPSLGELKKLDRELDQLLAKKKHHRHHHKKHHHHRHHKKGSKLTQLERRLDKTLDKVLGKK
jgi:hypothetical protein